MDQDNELDLPEDTEEIDPETGLPVENELEDEEFPAPALDDEDES